MRKRRLDDPHGPPRACLDDGQHDAGLNLVDLHFADGGVDVGIEPALGESAKAQPPSGGELLFRRQQTLGFGRALAALDQCAQFFVPIAACLMVKDG